MIDGEGPGFRVEELERIVKAADPAAVLLPDRLMRRAIRGDRGLAAVGLRVPHRENYAMDGLAALQILGRTRLGLGPGELPPKTAILVARPSRESLARLPRGEALTLAWRRLFHARVHVAMAERRLTVEELDARIARIGVGEFDEIREVLRQEGDLLPPRDDRATFEEFAAHFLETWHFAATLLPGEFPALRDLGRIHDLLDADVDASGLLARTRPEGAPEPRKPSVDDDRDELSSFPKGRPPIGARAVCSDYGLLAGAAEAARRGNSVRAAILRNKSAGSDPSRQAGKVRSQARAELDRLAARLRAALGLDGEETKRWRGALPPLLDRASEGGWTPEARLLYDLQNVCVDHERDVYAVDLVEWALTLGRRPLRRHLPSQREVLISKHLRSAARRLPATRLPERDRARLDALLRDAIHQAETRLRDRLRPLIGDALGRTGMVPANLPERVALRKLVEELLDLVIGRGFLAMGDLRDALSRSNLKLPDLAGPGELIAGDRLLRADRNLAVALDGVYRRGELYLRALQKFSSVAFGTPGGRFLTRYLALPFGAAFVLIEGLQHLSALFLPRSVERELHLLNPSSLVAVGGLLFGLIHSPEFRARFLAVMRAIGRVIRSVVIDAPSWCLGRPWVRRIVESRAFATAWRWGARPLVPAGLVWMALGNVGINRPWRDVGSAAAFLGWGLLLNSSVGQDLEELLTDAVVHGWHHVRDNLLPGLYRAIMEASARALEAIDRALYAGDEWLRFRVGQGRLTFGAKALLGVGWFFVVYAIRFVVTLLIEPQVNPVKHFPVVTVSHKIILPMSPQLLAILRTVVPHAAEGITGVTVLLLPGIFGFLVWELKENWRLYEANRRPDLEPVVVGHHGETMARLLRPGFHSGTIPKLYARLRKANRSAFETGRRKSALKQLAALEHAEVAIRHFVDRDVIALLRDGEAKPWVEAGEIALATNRIQVELRRPGHPHDCLEVTFEERGGKLVAGLRGDGWPAHLDLARRRTLSAALAGLFQMSGSDLIREPSPADLWKWEGCEPLPPPPPESPDPQDAAISWRRWVAFWESPLPDDLDR